MGDISHYEQYLLESPELSKELSDMYWGMEPPQEVTLRFSNADGYFSTLIQSEELRNKTVRLRRYDPNESGSNRLRFEMFGVITDYNILDEAEITVTLNNPDPMQTKLPRHVYDMTSFSESRPLIYNPPDDLGAPYPLIFGRCRKVPCVYVHYNATGNQYDYIVGRGPIESIDNVYGDKVRRKPVTDYTSFDGSQTTPYPGYAFIRFNWDQMNFDGSWCEITADVKGMEMGGSTAQRNFAYVIKELMSNTTWGLGLAVNNPAFEQAAIDLEGYYCDGAIIEQKTAQDILNDLLFACKGRLSQNEDGEWLLHIDKAITDIAAYFGSGEGKWENIIEITKYGKTPTSNCPKNVILNYNYDFETNNYLSKYERNVFSFGEDRTYETNFIRDHTTADKLTCYLKNLAYYTDTKLEMTVGQEGRHLDVWSKCDIQITRFGIESQMRIKSLTKRLESFDLGFESHNNLIYTYTPTGRYNIDPDTTASERPDYKNPDAPKYEKPKTPVSISGLAPWGYSMSGTGEVTAHLIGRAFKDPDDINFAYMQVGIRLWDSTSANDYTWYNGYEYDKATDEWRVKLSFPASSMVTSAYVEGTGGVTKYFDAQVVSVNSFGRRSDPKYFYGESIGWKDQVVGSTPIVPTKITTIYTYSSFKNFSWTWTPCDVLDLKDYHVQIGTSSGASDLMNTFVKSNTFSYTTTRTFDTFIYFRVRPRNTTCVEAWIGVNNWTDATCLITNSITIPDDSLTGTMIAPALAGNGLTQDGSGNLQVNTDGSTLEISSDAVRVKADGINETHIRWSTLSAAPDTTSPSGSALIDIAGGTYKIAVYPNS